MIISKHAQGSIEWMQARAGIPTASEFDNLVTPKWEVRTGQMPKTYLARKLAEWWQGGPLLDFNTFDMDQGRLLEEEAIPWYELEFGKKISRVGLITTDDGRIGCSPDGLIEGECGIEVKCPTSPVHIKYLLDGNVPPEYVAQVYGSMFVTGTNQWRFLSYCRRHPQLVITVDWDPYANEALVMALDKFLEKFTKAQERMIELNGGPPKRSQFKPVTATHYGDQNDVPIP